MAFEKVQSMLESQQGIYHGSIIWSCRKATLRNRIPRSLHLQSSTFENLSLSITKIT